MPIVIAQVSRVWPLLLGLIVVFIVAYLVLNSLKGERFAKEMLIRIFWWIGAIGCAFAGIATAYAFSEGNHAGWEFFGSCLVTMGIIWVVDLICHAVFKKHNPHYRVFPTRDARR